MEHLVVNTRELDNPDYAGNPTNRCYFCKSTLYSDLAKLAEQKGYACVVDGANKDDEGDYRRAEEPPQKSGSSPCSRRPGCQGRGRGADGVPWSAHVGPAGSRMPVEPFPVWAEVHPEKLSQVARAEEFMRRRALVVSGTPREIARLEVGPEARKGPSP